MPERNRRIFKTFVEREAAACPDVGGTPSPEDAETQSLEQGNTGGKKEKGDLDRRTKPTEEEERGGSIHKWSRSLFGETTINTGYGAILKKKKAGRYFQKDPGKKKRLKGREVIFNLLCIATLEVGGGFEKRTNEVCAENDLIHEKYKGGTSQLKKGEERMRLAGTPRGGNRGC